MKHFIFACLLLSVVIAVGCAEVYEPQRKTMSGGNIVDNTKGPLTPVDYYQYGRPPIHVNILLLIPDEFSHYTYISTFEGNQIRHSLGQDAEQELRTAFGIEFASMEIWPVRSESKAIEMLSPSDPYNSEIREYDYAVIPEFMHVESTADNDNFKFGVDMWTRFYAKDGSSVTLKGYGETLTGKYTVSTPEESARLTIKYAVSAILDGIEKKRGTFVHTD